jgi:hypothetical protein
MKLFFFIIITIIFLPIIINAQEIKVDVLEILDVEVQGLKYNSVINNGEPLKVSFDLFNSGSVGYKARVRLDIFKQNNLTQTLWSNEEDFFPGVSHHFDIYYPVNMIGNFKAVLKVYLANEIKEMKPFNFQVKKTTLPSETFDIKDFNTYEKELEFNIISNKTIEKVLIIPTNCPLGWICEQKKIERIKESDLSKIELSYEPSLWKESEITINILTEDGKYITTKSFTLKRVGTWKQFLHDFIRIFNKYYSRIF